MVCDSIRAMRVVSRLIVPSLTCLHSEYSVMPFLGYVHCSTVV